MSFHSKLRVLLLEDEAGRPILRDGRLQWVLTEPVIYEVGHKGSGEFIEAPAGFVTDYSSVPRMFYRLEPPGGPSAKAAVIHDVLYATEGLGGRYTRKQADDIFKEALGVLGVSGWKRGLMWSGVRVGGSRGWGS